MQTLTARHQGRIGWRAVAAVSGIALVGVAALSGCGSNSTVAGSSTGGSSSVAGKKVILVHCGDVNPWCAVYNKTIIDGLQAAGVKTEYLQDPFDVNLEIQHLQSAIAAHPDLILLSPTDDNSVVPSLQQAKAQNVPVIYNNSRPAAGAESLVAATVDADQSALGRFAAENIIAGLKAEGLTSANVIAITGSDATFTSGDRMVAFKKALAAYPKYKLVAEKNGNWDPALTGKIASQLFAQYQSNGGIQAAYGMADYQANAIVQSAQQAGLPIGVGKKGLIITGSNCFKVGIDNIKAGLQYGTATQSPDVEGQSVVKWSLKFLAGEKIPAVNLSSEAAVTSANLSQYEAACTKA